MLGQGQNSWATPGVLFYIITELEVGADTGTSGAALIDAGYVSMSTWGPGGISLPASHQADRATKAHVSSVVVMFTKANTGHSQDVHVASD